MDTLCGIFNKPKVSSVYGSSFLVWGVIVAGCHTLVVLRIGSYKKSPLMLPNVGENAYFLNVHSQVQLKAVQNR